MPPAEDWSSPKAMNGHDWVGCIFTFSPLFTRLLIILSLSVKPRSEIFPKNYTINYVTVYEKTAFKNDFGPREMAQPENA